MYSQSSVFTDQSRPTAMSPATPVVFVVDDDISVRESLQLLLHAAGWQARIFPTAQAFLDHPSAMVPSCLILDVNLPGLNGLDLQQRIAAERPHMPIIFITGFGDVPITVRAMKAGAVEFLTKPFDDVVLLQAIDSAIDRSRDALGRERNLQALRTAYATLTPREQQVLAMVVAGRLNKQIGADLEISEITVKAHRGKVMRKMKAHSLADLVKMATALSAAPPGQD
ncbi:MAG: response regulator transcription factor [Rhodanobacter sp.]|jgi:FixJ family two-component response regulator|nr:response regulator transcription factor [Rhodanobacter sp.]